MVDIELPDVLEVILLQNTIRSISVQEKKSQTIIVHATRCVHWEGSYKSTIVSLLFFFLFFFLQRPQLWSLMRLVRSLMRLIDLIGGSQEPSPGVHAPGKPKSPMRPDSVPSQYIFSLPSKSTIYSSFPAFYCGAISVSISVFLAFIGTSDAVFTQHSNNFLALWLGCHLSDTIP